MEVSIIIDSNALYVHNHKDYTKLEFIDFIKNLMKDIKVNNLCGNVNIALPEVVIKELIAQQHEKYKTDIAKYKKVKFPLFEIIENKEYGDYLLKLFEKDKETLLNYEGNIYFRILPYPKEKLFKKTINRAIEKKPPFEGLEKNSDKGFKDVVIWESLLEYKKENPEQRIILISNDNIFNDSEKSEILQKEYKGIAIDDLYFVKWYPRNNKALFEVLSEIYKVKIIIPSTVELYKKFEDVLVNSNIMDLYEQYSFKNSLDNGVYYAKSVNFLKFNFLGTPTSYYENGKEFLYFVVEIKIELVFEENEMYGRYMSQVEYYEFEIYYYPTDNQFSIIGYDEPGEYNRRMKEFFLIKNNLR